MAAPSDQRLVLSPLIAHDHRLILRMISRHIGKFN